MAERPKQQSLLDQINRNKDLIVKLQADIDDIQGNMMLSIQTLRQPCRK
jgi:hypothetical protein